MDLNLTINWDLEQLYDAVKSIEFTLEPELRTKLELVEFGNEFKLQDQKNNPIHILNYTKGNYRESPFNNKAYIYGVGNYPIKWLWEDITERKQLMREILASTDLFGTDATTQGEFQGKW